MHGQSGSSMDGLPIMRNLLTQNIALLLFDFRSCGQSQGEFTTLGINEKGDLQAVLAYAKRLNRFSKIALWGRSMGAVTTILYCS